MGKNNIDIDGMEDRFKDRYSKKQKPETRMKQALHEIKALRKDKDKLNQVIETTDILVKCLLEQLEGNTTITDEEMRAVRVEKFHIDTKNNKEGNALILTLIKNYDPTKKQK